MAGPGKRKKAETRIYDKMTAWEKVHAATNPFHWGPLRKAYDKAWAEARRRFPGPWVRNGRGDAFLHCYWSALLTRDIGMNNAKAFTDAHEDFDGNPIDEKEMDLYNNARGLGIAVRLGPKASDANLADACAKALHEGRLKVILQRKGAAKK